MPSYYGYTRVSTAKQGEQGVSLVEQRSAIETYATRNGLSIVHWFEERETAAKRGRPVFERMMNMLRAGKALGVVIHKIDRSARNLKDWSDLAELMDRGVEVHFANEALDMHSRGGRLSADIQAVVAADFIRNLRDETRKGMRGRYRQGLFPLPAPIGYLDCGRGQPKTIDPIQGPLVRKMFELYATGQYGQTELANIMYSMGLRTKRGKRVDKSTFNWMLANPFYTGMIRLKSTGELFEGRHQSLISQTLFRTARTISEGRLYRRVTKHEFTYRRSIRCSSCGLNLTSERVSGITYYRCRSGKCAANAIREENLSRYVSSKLAELQLAEEEYSDLYGALEEINDDERQQRSDVINALESTIKDLSTRLSRLADAFLEGILDRSLLQEKQNALLSERRENEERLRTLKTDNNLLKERLKEFLDFASNVNGVFEEAPPTVQREMLDRVASRLSLTDRRPHLHFKRPYQILADIKQFRGLPRSGVGGVDSRTSKAAGGVELLATVEQSDDLPPSESIKSCNGCPSPVGLQRGAKAILLEISRELLTERLSYLEWGKVLRASHSGTEGLNVARRWKTIRV